MSFFLFITGEFTTNLKNDFKIPRMTSTETNDEPRINIETYTSPLSVIDNNEFASLASIALKDPPPPPPPAWTEPIQSSNLTSRKRTMGNHDGLPTELLKLIQPLCCELCSAKLNSPVSAKMHYESKNHEKKINAWLLQWSTKTGEPMPKRPTPKNGPTGPHAMHCDICDISLTSIQHANQHYSGKKHRQ